MANEKRTENRVPTLVGVSNSDLTTPELLAVDPATNRLLVSAVITSGGGGGTQYTEGDTDTTITGTAMMWEDASDTLEPVSADKPLPVAIISGAGSGGTASDDDADFTAGTTSGTPAMGVYESTPSSVTDGDLGIVGITEDRRLKVLADLSATDNAVLDTIDAVLDTIKVDTEAIETAVEALQSGQLADGHNVTIDNASGASAVNIQDGGNTITVDGTVTANLSATDNTVLDNIDADTSAIQTAVEAIQTAVEGTLTVDSELTTADLDTGAGTDTRAVVGLVGSASGGGALIPGSATDGLLVNLGSNNDVTVSGTVTAELSATDNAVLDNIDSDLTTIIGHVDGIEALLGTIDTDTGNIATAASAIQTAVQIMDDWDDGSDRARVVGAAAHDAAVAGNPVLQGGEARTTNPTAVGDGDVVRPMHDDIGRAVTQPLAPRDLYVAPTVVTISNTTETTILAAGGSGVFHDAYAILINNTSATAARVDIRDATGGTIRFAVYVPAGDVRGLSLGMIPQTTANNNWTAQASASVTDLRITLFAVKTV